MSPRRPPAPAETGQRPTPSAGARGRPAGQPAARPRAGRPPGARPPASTRPRPASAGRVEATRRATKAGTGRPLWVLGAVGVVLALLILPYFQKWLIQRSEIEAARAAVNQSQVEVAQLEAEEARWADDDFIKAQARERLGYVMPGEVGLRVVSPQPEPAVPDDPGTEAAELPVGERPWFADIWRSAQVAAETEEAEQR